MSFSPDQPMGYLAEGATPFQPRAFPMTGEDLGLPTGEGTPMPAGTTFEGAPVRMPAPEETVGAGFDPTQGGTIPAPSVMGSPLPLDIDIDELLKDIDVEQAIENLPTPAPQPVAIPQPVAAPVVSTPITPPPLPQIVPERQPVMPSIPVIPPVLEAPTPIVDVPMNLGLPMLENLAPVQIPEIPFQLPQISQPVSIPTLPVVNTPVMPQPSPRALLGTL